MTCAQRLPQAPFWDPCALCRRLGSFIDLASNMLDLIGGDESSYLILPLASSTPMCKLYKMVMGGYFLFLIMEKNFHLELES